MILALTLVDLSEKMSLVGTLIDPSRRTVLADRAGMKDEDERAYNSSGLCKSVFSANLMNGIIGKFNRV